jgi:hypothetical protein
VRGQFAFHQIRQELDRVLTAIWLALERRAEGIPHLNPLPLRKGEATMGTRGENEKARETYGRQSPEENLGLSLNQTHSVALTCPGIAGFPSLPKGGDKGEATHKPRPAPPTQHLDRQLPTTQFAEPDHTALSTGNELI